MIYVHKDTIYNNQSLGSWGIPIYKDLKRRGIPSKIIDGHNIEHILNAFSKISKKPKLILAKTIKGKGFKFSENNNDWHHKVLTKSQYDEAVNYLNNNEI